MSNQVASRTIGRIIARHRHRHCAHALNGDAGQVIRKRLLPTDFDTITLRQGASDGIKDFLDCDVGVFRRQRWEAGGDGGDQISAGHGSILPSVVCFAFHCHLDIGEVNSRFRPSAA
jgi:hypothetical protein